MLSKAQISDIRLYHQKKHRQNDDIFVAEGTKIIAELIIANFKVKMLVGTAEGLDDIEAAGAVIHEKTEVIETNTADIEKITMLFTPPSVFALVEAPEHSFNQDILGKKWVLALDTIQDPGNMGTIMRTADWFGIDTIICSPDTADYLNPKVIQATMGSICRMEVHYGELDKLFKTHPTIPVYGAMMKGKNIFKEKTFPTGIILLGNEGNGINPDLQTYISQAITIPGSSRAESLNVGVAAGIIMGQMVQNY